MNDPDANPNPGAGSTGLACRPATAWYALLVICAALAAAYYRLRTDSIFGCQGRYYSAAQYLSYCQTTGYGDFDHGAFWFNLEPEATRSAAAADLLFVGNSRMVYAFSSTTAREWFAGNAPSYFLLGFAYYPRVLFMRSLMRKIAPRARVYVVNLDSFFEESASVPARYVMDDPGAASHYRYKQYWQYWHRALCGRLRSFCGDSYAIFKDRRTGAWQASGLILAHEATSLDPKFDAAAVARESMTGRKFLEEFGVDPQCVIFTLVPTVDAPSATSAAIAAALHVEFIVPELDDLLTFDGSHLDQASAERWSGAFFDAAGPKICKCLSAARAAPATAAR
jgi:hypothetical protein